MNHTNCLIVTHGFFGDIIFASSVAEKLILEKQYDKIDFLIGFPQMKRLLQNNPFINNVFVSQMASPSPFNNEINFSNYNKVIRLNPLSFEEPPPLEFQKVCGVKNPNTFYKTYTEPEYDLFASESIKNQFNNDKKTIAVMKNWREKTFLFTEEQYEIGIDVPNLGYGGSHRDINFIVNELNNHFNIVYVGFDSNVSQFNTQSLRDDEMGSLLYDCSLMKSCDGFIGAEGGLANLAAGAGVKTIITGDFVHQLYGWNGVIKKIKEPKLGPKFYFPEFGHVTLNPYLTDEEVINEIINNFTN
jgi:hypothetical protein